MQETQQHGAVDVFIGVDVGKGQHHAVALDRNGKRLYNKALPNDETKLRALIAELKVHGRLLFVVDQPSTIGALSVTVVRAGRCPWSVDLERGPDELLLVDVAAPVLLRHGGGTAAFDALGHQ